MVAIDASLHAQLGQLPAGVEKLGRRLSGVERAMLRPPAQPFTMRNEASDVVAAGSPDLVLDLGGPQSGRYWYVMGVTVGGLTYATVAAGTALLVISGAPPRNAASVGLAAVYDQAANLPLPATYSRGQLPLRANDRLYVIIVGGTAAQPYTAAATIEQYEDGNRVQTTDS